MANVIWLRNSQRLKNRVIAEKNAVAKEEIVVRAANVAIEEIAANVEIVATEMIAVAIEETVVEVRVIVIKSKLLYGIIIKNPVLFRVQDFLTYCIFY
jgi:Ser-tRNA(Ala) deacylase AlaX